MSVAIKNTISRSEKRLVRARAVIQSELTALERLLNDLDELQFDRAVELILGCTGNVIMCGIGKAGLVAQKISASLASKGTPSHFLHPSEAVHGDLGKVKADDVVVFLSYSGETAEVTSILKPLNAKAAATIAITSTASNTLAEGVDVPLLVGKHREACLHGLAPTTSTTLMMAIGDALALVVSEAREFTRDNFKEFHPGGSLGRNLCSVEEIMRPLKQCRLARDTSSVGDVFVQSSLPGRRTGAIMLVDATECLTGIFTDSDLARLLETQRDAQLDQPIATVMTSDPVTVQQGTSLAVAIRELQARKISELPIVDEQGCPVGLIDITDVVAGAQDDLDTERSSEACSVDLPAVERSSGSSDQGGSEHSKARIISLPNRNEVDS